MSLNVIIIAVLAVVVLLVLIFVFTGKIKLFGKSSESCESRGGTCVASCPAGVSYTFGTDCGKRKEAGEAGVTGPICCVLVDDKSSGTPAAPAK